MAAGSEGNTVLTIILYASFGVISFTVAILSKLFLDHSKNTNTELANLRDAIKDEKEERSKDREHLKEVIANETRRREVWQSGKQISIQELEKDTDGQKKRLYELSEKLQKAKDECKDLINAILNRKNGNGI
jgi:hypothetical protein